LRALTSDEEPVDEQGPNFPTKPSKRITSKRHRRHGRVLGNFIKRQLVEEDGKPTDLGTFLSENAFDKSVNVVDVTLAKFTMQAALIADRSFMQIFPGTVSRSVFMTGNSKHALQAAWSAFSDVYTGLILPLKDASIGGLHPLAIAVGSVIASQHQYWMVVLKDVLAQH
jgi:hypothetical protein